MPLSCPKFLTNNPIRACADSSSDASTNDLRNASPAPRLAIALRNPLNLPAAFCAASPCAFNPAAARSDELSNLPFSALALPVASVKYLMPLAAILNLSLDAAVVAFNLSTAWLVACAPCCTARSCCGTPRLSRLMPTLTTADIAHLVPTFHSTLLMLDWVAPADGSP